MHGFPYRTDFNRRKPTLAEAIALAPIARQHPRYYRCQGHWGMVEGGGVTIYDLSGNRRHATMQNMDPATDWVISRRGYALDLDGGNDHLTTTSFGFNYNNCTAVVSFIADNVANRETLFDLGSNTNIVPQIEVKSNGSDGDWGIIEPGTFLQNTNDQPLTSGALHTIVWRNANEVASFWTDGAENAVTGSAKTLSSEAAVKNIGQRGNNSQEFDGRILFVRCYDVPVAAQWITTFTNDPWMEWVWAAELLNSIYSGKAAAAGGPIEISVAGSMTPAGILVRDPKINGAGSLSPAGAVTLVKTLLQSVAGVVATTGVLFRLPAKLPGGTLSLAGSIVLQIQKLASGGITPTGAVATVKAGLQSVAGALTPVGAMAVGILKQLGGTLAPSGIVAKASRKILTGTSGMAGQVIRSSRQRLLGALTPSGATTPLKTGASEELEGEVAPAGAVSRAVSLGVAGILNPAGAIVRFVAKLLAATITPTGQVYRLIAESVTGVLSFVGSLARSVIDILLPIQVVELQTELVTSLRLETEFVPLVALSVEVNQ